MFKRILDEYFAFNHQQRKGLFVLACLSLLLFLARLIMPMFIVPDQISIQQLPVLPFEKPQSLASENKQLPANAYTDDHQKFMFDPNTITVNELCKLGFSESIAAHVMKLRRKGVVFKEKADLKQIFGMDENFYRELEPFINIQWPLTNIGHDTFTVKEKLSKRDDMIDVNIADSLALMALHILDAGQVKRLLKYRQRLGGFVQMSQLSEVFGFDEKLVKKLSVRLSLKRLKIKKIDPNKSSLYSLRQHPYIGDSAAAGIARQRKIKSLTSGDVFKILASPAEAKKLGPYLTFH